MIRMLVSMASAALLILAAAISPDWSRAQTVTVIETEYQFDPNRLTFRVGVPYRLHFENRGTELHEFTAPAFLKSIERGSPDPVNREGTEIALQPGEKADLYFVPRQPGRYPFICADHDWAGMTGEIVIDPSP